MPPKGQNLSTEPAEQDFSGSINSIAGSLDLIGKCLAVLAIQSTSYKDKPDTERIPFLGSMGYSVDAIATILDTTPGTVRKQLSISRTSKRKKKSTPKKVKPDAENKQGTT